jgi:CHAD domain-containing protein
MARKPAQPPAPKFQIGTLESVAAAVLRVARAQFTAAMAVAGDLRRAESERIHEARKHCKKLRALLRLIRGHDEAFYVAENAALRDAARELSGQRDVDVMLAACDALHATCKDRCVRSQLARVRAALLQRQSGASRGDRTAARRCLAQFAARMQAGRERLPFWPVATARQFDLEAAFEQTYRRGRRAMRRAMTEPLEENFHEWRKLVKDHGYQLRLLRATWPVAVKDRLAEVDRLSEILGDERDISLLAQVVAGEITIRRRVGRRRALPDVIDQRRVGLLAKAMELGERLFWERPAQMLVRFRGWQAAA